MSYKGYKKYRESFKNIESLNILERLKELESSEIVKQGLKIIEFYERYGEKATKEAT